MNITNHVSTGRAATFSLHLDYCKQMEDSDDCIVVSFLEKGSEGTRDINISRKRDPNYIPMTFINP